MRAGGGRGTRARKRCRDKRSFVRRVPPQSRSRNRRAGFRHHLQATSRRYLPHSDHLTGDRILASLKPVRFTLIEEGMESRGGVNKRLGQLGRVS